MYQCEKVDTFMVSYYIYGRRTWCVLPADLFSRKIIYTVAFDICRQWIVQVVEIHPRGRLESDFLHGQYHVCWWPDDVNIQGISRHYGQARHIVLRVREGLKFKLSWVAPFCIIIMVILIARHPLVSARRQRPGNRYFNRYHIFISAF